MAHKAIINSDIRVIEIEYEEIVFDKSGIIFYTNNEACGFCPYDRIITITQDKELLAQPSKRKQSKTTL